MAQPTVTIHLLKPDKGQTVTYTGELVRAATGYALVRAAWSRGRLDLGYTVFEPGDLFLEHFYADRWYNVFEVRAAGGELKGWYCNITRPAQLTADTITSEDLALDLFVPPERARPLRLDVDEFEALGLAQSDPATYAAAYAALDELEGLALAGVPPFDTR
jgi:predicted RNA-binding protein associated with RNAse of E/G family